MFCVKNYLVLTSLTGVSISTMPEILSSISYILFVMLVSVAPVHLPTFSISRFPSVCVFFIFFYFCFQVFNVFIHFLQLCLFVFFFDLSWHSIRDLFIPIFFCLFLDFFK